MAKSSLPDPFATGVTDVIGDALGTNKAREAAERQAEMARMAAQLQQDQANKLWEDTEGLRSLRDTSLGGLNRMTGGDRSDFYKSPEYRQVANESVGTLDSKLNSRMGGNRLSALRGKAAEPALGEYGNYYNRIAQTAGITSGGLNATNSQMQAATDAQTRLLGDAASAGASGLIGAANQAKSTAMGIGGIAASIFSDIRLKENITLIGNDGGINYYYWDWTDEAKAIVGDQSNIGVLAQEVQKTHPKAVTEHPSGYLTVNYSELH